MAMKAAAPFCDYLYVSVDEGAIRKNAVNIFNDGSTYSCRNSEGPV
eukprot:CAMPEP_0172840504 /NCGR_PEP_ID=MMETSP1075-20121228/29362_1 /TAXON_ID=2916 /ORGANISM="Ceratium fusus, Strain PA161109" /LENGTH=45 /DNA_ID= /DNA_START= /DNA_END= /DNA_ORIENTATION=